MTTSQTSERAFVVADLVLGIDHVGVAVPDLDAAVAFYAEVLGMVERHREVNTEQGVVEAMMTTPFAPGGSSQLQLLAPLTPESMIARFLDRSGPGLQQLAYRVADVERVNPDSRSFRTWPSIDDETASAEHLV